MCYDHVGHPFGAELKSQKNTVCSLTQWLDGAHSQSYFIQYHQTSLKDNCKLNLMSVEEIHRCRRSSQSSQIPVDEANAHLPYWGTPCSTNSDHPVDNIYSGTTRRYEMLQSQTRSLEPNQIVFHMKVTVMSRWTRKDDIIET